MYPLDLRCGLLIAQDFDWSTPSISSNVWVSASAVIMHTTGEPSTCATNRTTT